MTGKARIEKPYRGFVLLAAPLRGRWTGAITRSGEQLYQTNHNDADELIAMLENRIEDRPEVLLHESEETQSYGNFSLHTVKVRAGYVSLCVFRDSCLLKSGVHQDSPRSMNALKAAIDEDPDLLGKATIQNHKAKLKDLNIGTSRASQARKASSYKTLRAAHCWACHHPIDNQSMYECVSCGWIICFCGACGCGYENSSAINQ